MVTPLETPGAKVLFLLLQRLLQRLGKCGVSWIPPHQSRKKFPLLRFVRGCLGSAPGPARQLPVKAVPLLPGAKAKNLGTELQPGAGLLRPCCPKYLGESLALHFDFHQWCE